jgi:hypothetical protein
MNILWGRGTTTAGGETRWWGTGDAVFLKVTPSPDHGTTIFEETMMVVIRCGFVDERDGSVPFIKRVHYGG